MVTRRSPDKYLIVRIAGLVVIVLGAAVIVGWAFDLSVLKRIWPGIPATKANAAVMLVAAGAGLAALARTRPSRLERVFSGAVGGFCVVLSALTLLEYVWRPLGIDELVFHDATGSPEPGRPSPHAAAGLLLVGVNLFLLARNRKGGSLARFVNNTLVVVVMAGIIGYAYHVKYLRGFSSVNGIGVNALTGLAILVTGLAALNPRGTWLAVFISPGAGGRMARRFAPLVLLSPILIGVQTAFYNKPIGHAIAAVTVTTAFAITLYAGASALDHAEAERKYLGGLLPICSYCKRIRNDDGYWNQVESYIAANSEAEFSHSLCPNCLREHYPDQADEIISQLEESGLMTGVEDAT
jgi:hypothetical protein